MRNKPISKLSLRLKKWNKTGKKVLRRTKDFVANDRTLHTRFVYTALSIGTVLLAYVLVLANIGIFSLMEKSLYDRETYEAVNIVSAGGITDPLSRSVRVELYQSCTMQGADRAPLPEERTRADAIAQIQSLWEQTLAIAFKSRPNETLNNGDSMDRVLRGSHYTATLHDFYNEQTSAKIAIWGAQAYYTASNGTVYCLSAELDSRTNDIYSMTVALFECIDGSEPETDFYPMLDTLGESRSAASNGTVTKTETGSVTTLSLSDGIQLTRETQPGVQFYLTLQ
ncbi:MAG: hypothetical protein IJK01_00345 [Clostridia bacterium]|jgi:hypothetical protein|nr:hypothetical protein [Clostridia bacterium]